MDKLQQLILRIQGDVENYYSKISTCNKKVKTALVLRKMEHTAVDRKPLKSGEGKRVFSE